MLSPPGKRNAIVRTGKSSSFRRVSHNRYKASIMSATPRSAPVPVHVPPHLVQPYPLIFGEVTTEDPFKSMIPRIHEGPEVLYSTEVYPGHQPGWVCRRA